MCVTARVVSCGARGGFLLVRDKMSALGNVDITKAKLSDLNINVLNSIFPSKHSFCWTHFGQLVVNLDGKKRAVLADQVFCDACLKSEKEKDGDVIFSKAHIKAYSKNIATSNLLRHLKDEHSLEDTQRKPKKIDIKEFFSVHRKSKPITTTSEIGKKDKWLLARDLALWFARSLMPFDSIDDDAMQDFLMKYNVIVSDSDLPSRQNIAREGLEDVYDSMLTYVKKLILKQKIRFGAVTTDLWTDQFRRRNYLTCTFHFISQEMELMKFTLATKQVIEKHTGENIKEEIQEVLRQFQIPQKDIILVTDAGSNMKRAAILMNVQNHLCLGHALHNLVTVDGIQNTDEVFQLINRCKAIVKHLRYRAPQLEAAANKEQRELLSSLETFGEHLEQTDGDDVSNESEGGDSATSSTHIRCHAAPPTIKTSTPTRWHSMLMMLSSISHSANRRVIRDMLIDTGRSTLLLSENDYNLIASITSFLDKFKKIVEILSSDSHTTINLALVFKSEIKRLLEESDDDEQVVITRLKNSMLRKLDHRFPVTDTIVAATLLDSRFHLIKEIDTFMESHNTTKVAFLTNIVKKIVKKEDIVDLVLQDPIPGPSSAPTAANFLMDLAKKHSSTQCDMNSEVENECWRYFSTACVKDLQPYNDSVLKFWKDRKVSFPWLSNLARAILFVPATSTPSERVFSVAGQIITAKRSRLNSLRVNRILFIHDNYSLCRKNW